MLAKISGYKTYCIALATIGYALVHYFLLGDLSSQQCVELVLGATGLGALRHGVSTEVAALIGNIGPAILDAVKTQVEKQADPVTTKVDDGQTNLPLNRPQSTKS